MRSRWRGALLAACAVLALDAAPAWSRDEVLLIGNSFTKGIRKQLRSLGRSAGRDVSVRVSAKDGFTLGHHVGSRSTQRRLASREWDWVILQEQSDGIDVERYPDARILAGQAAAIGAQTMFFMTWADRDEPLERYDELRGEPGGEQGYVPIAFELGAGIAPIGWAFREVLLEEAAPELWRIDGHHASERGRFLASCVLYAAIYGESPVGLWASPKLDPAEALHDQQLAADLVVGDAISWNLGVPAP